MSDARVARKNVERFDAPLVRGMVPVQSPSLPARVASSAVSKAGAFLVAWGALLGFDAAGVLALSTLLGGLASWIPVVVAVGGVLTAGGAAAVAAKVSVPFKRVLESVRWVLATPRSARVLRVAAEDVQVVALESPGSSRLTFVRGVVRRMERLAEREYALYVDVSRELGDKWGSYLASTERVLFVNTSLPRHQARVVHQLVAEMESIAFEIRSLGGAVKAEMRQGREVFASTYRPVVTPVPVAKRRFSSLKKWSLPKLGGADKQQVVLVDLVALWDYVDQNYRYWTLDTIVKRVVDGTVAAPKASSGVVHTVAVSDLRIVVAERLAALEDEDAKARAAALVEIHALQQETKGTQKDLEELRKKLDSRLSYAEVQREQQLREAALVSAKKSQEVERFQVPSPLEKLAARQHAMKTVGDSMVFLDVSLFTIMAENWYGSFSELVAAVQLTSSGEGETFLSLNQARQVFYTHRSFELTMSSAPWFAVSTLEDHWSEACEFVRGLDSIERSRLLNRVPGARHFWLQVFETIDLAAEAADSAKSATLLVRPAASNQTHLVYNELAKQDCSAADEWIFNERNKCEQYFSADDWESFNDESSW